MFTAGPFEKLTLKVLPSSDVLHQISLALDVKSAQLEALGRALNADKNLSFVSQPLTGGRESFVLSTPRYRVGFFEDRFDSNTVVVKYVEKNSFDRWTSERFKSKAFSKNWTTAYVPSGGDRSVLDSVRRTDHTRGSDEFWGFWESILENEQKTIDTLKKHPGWPYMDCRPGLRGGFEFKVGETRDAILQACGSTFLVSHAKPEELDRSGRRPPSFIFEIQRSEASDWIAGVPRSSNLRFEIKKNGRLGLDWVGSATEYQRKKQAFNRLLSGHSALPGLSALLLSGAQSSISHGGFKQIISTPYNEEQASAISKALLSDSLTCVLGPPGTGKTSVIAEIAAQQAATGKRVLISSQANLAVDNALEKMMQVDQIFAVRLGRPESVKLNPELLLENASIRYQNRLLLNSAAGELRTKKRIQSETEGLPSAEQLSTWIAQWNKVREHSRSLKDALATKGRSQERLTAAQQGMALAEAGFASACSLAGIKVGDASRFLAVCQRLTSAGHQPSEVGARAAEITFALTNRAPIEHVAKRAAQLATDIERRGRLQSEIRTKNQAIERYGEKDKHLDRARREIADHNKKKAGAGFFKSIWLEVSGPSHNIAELERERQIALSLSDEARRSLPDLRSTADMLDKSIMSATGECGLYIKQMVGQEPHTHEISTLSKGWMAKLEYALAIRTLEAVPYLESLRHHDHLRKVKGTRERAESELKDASFEAARVSKSVATAEKVLATVADPSPSLVALAKRLGHSASVVDLQGIGEGDDATESTQYFDQLRELRTAAVRRSENWPLIAEALSRYRSRLRQPLVDLQQAVLSEANVVGATCSGIAGAKTFEGDFDCVIVDEAGRATPLDVLMPIVRGRTVVLVGDHRQLPPFIGEHLMKDIDNDTRSELDTSIFQKIYEGSHSDRRQGLRKQYRMAPAICDIVREISYQEATMSIETAGGAVGRGHGIAGMASVHWIRPIGDRNFSKSVADRGLVNPAEVEAAVDTFMRIASSPYLSSRSGYSVGIISMYRQQSKEIERQLELPRRQHANINLEIGTVDSFQGREKDAIILTFSETDPRRQRFFYDRRRLNVALSRAKELLIIIGSIDDLGSKRMAFGKENPIFELRTLIEHGLGVSSSKETFSGGA